MSSAGEGGPKLYNSIDSFISVGTEVDISSLTISSTPRTELQRTLKFQDGVSVVFGIMVGTGIFASPGVVTEEVFSCISIAISVWLLSGFLSLLCGLCFAELGAALPEAGGDFIYLTKGLHRFVGFSYIWASFWCLKTGSNSIIAIIFARYFGSVVFDLENTENIDEDYRIKLLGIGCLVVIGSLNLLSVKIVAIVQNIGVVFKFLTVFLVIAFAIIGLSTQETLDIAKENYKKAFEITVPEGKDKIKGFDYVTSFGIACISALWAYDGFTNLNCVAEEIIRPEKNIPRSIVVGVLAVVCTYVIINLSYFCVLPLEDVINSSAVATDMAKAIVGVPGEIIMPLLVSVSAVGSLNGSILTSARIFFSAAREELFPFSKIMSKTSKSHVPYNAVIIQVIVSSILIIPGNFESLVNYFGFTAWIFNSLVVITLIRYRTFNKDLLKPFKVAPYPWVPFLVLIIAFAIISSAIIEAPWPSLTAVAFILAGCPFYMLFFWRGNCIKICWRKYKSFYRSKKEMILSSVGSWNRNRGTSLSQVE